MSGRPWLSIIIPTRQLNVSLARYIDQALAHWPETEIIIVEPDDQAPGPGASPSVSWPACRRAQGPRGRGTQCNAGARQARGELLMFLHDDTQLPADAPEVLAQAFGEPRVGAACFRLRFDRRHWLLAVYAFCSRVESVWTTFGDQALVIRREVFAELGGFPDWPLFEDVELTRRLRRRGGLVKLPSTVTTSAIRYNQRGIVRQQWRNALLLSRFLLGASPWKLAAIYEGQPRAHHRGKGA